MLSNEYFHNLVPNDIDKDTMGSSAGGDSTGELFSLVAQTSTNKFVVAASHETTERLESLNYAALASLLHDQEAMRVLVPLTMD